MSEERRSNSSRNFQHIFIMSIYTMWWLLLECKCYNGAFQMMYDINMMASATLTQWKENVEK